MTYGNSCDLTVSPFMGICGYDGAGEALKQIYGNLNAPSSSPEGAYVTIAQGDFIASPSTYSLGANAYLYVPANCATGAKCRVHVAFHGCEQSDDFVGTDFYENSGLNVWADTNSIIVLYPQVTKSTANPSGCWDWWGYTTAEYATKAGPQLSMVKAILDHLASGFPGNGDAAVDGSSTPQDAAVTDAGPGTSTDDASGTTIDAATPPDATPSALDGAGSTPSSGARTHGCAASVGRVTSPPLSVMLLALSAAALLSRWRSSRA